MNTTILKGLNPEQKKAVLCVNGPVLVTAGAGSGKTRVLTRRIAYLIKARHVPSRNILALTFTHKAAQEMKSRIGKLLNGQLNFVWASTFHALGIAILRRYHHYIGYNTSFTIASDSTQHTLIKNIIKLGLHKDIKQYVPSNIQKDIGSAKNNVVTPLMFTRKVKQYVKNLEPKIKNISEKIHAESRVGEVSKSDSNKLDRLQFKVDYHKTVAKVYVLYQKQLLKNKEMDFNDLIMKPVLLFKKYPDALKYYQDKFVFISVDEYQDTNEAQYQMVNLLASKYKNLCVVGDADQSIYGWRGANIKNILNFKNDYPHANIIYMNQNYRSTKNILGAANSIIKHNPHKHPKKLWTNNPTGAKVLHYCASNSYDEANYVASKLLQLKHQYHLHYRDFSILYRANYESRKLEQSFLKYNIPYEMVNGTKFLQRREIQDAFAYLTVIINPTDSIAFQQAIQTPRRGLGPASIRRMSAYATSHGETMLDTAGHIDKVKRISKRAVASVTKFFNAIKKQQAHIATVSLSSVLQGIMHDSGYVPALERKKTRNVTAQHRLDDLTELYKMADEYQKNNPDETGVRRISNFLNKATLQSAQDSSDKSKDKAEMMTVHAAKGLEFPIVFLYGMNDGVFPATYAQDMNEERRIAYVAVTRAQKRLIVTSSDIRVSFGHQGEPADVSPFIKEISNKYMDTCHSDDDFTVANPFRKQTVTKNPFRQKKPDISSNNFIQKYKERRNRRSHIKWNIGDKVKHRAWGLGTVIAISGKGSNVILKVHFLNGTTSNLLASVAPISKIKPKK